VSRETLTDQHPPKPRPHREVRSRRRWRLGMRQLLYLIFYCALACWLWRLVPSLIVVVSLSILGGMAVLFAVLLGRKVARRDAVLGIFALAAERELPLAPALDAIADQFAGRTRREMTELAAHLDAGLTLSEALDRVPNALSPDAELLARVGSEVGLLGAALRGIEATRRGLHSSWEAAAMHVVHWLWVLFVIQVVFSFTLTYVLPKYQYILADFGATPPAPTRILLQLGNQFVIPAMPFFLLMPFLELLAIAIALNFLAGPSHRFRIRLFDRLFNRRYKALTLRSLAWIVEGQYPLSRGLEHLADWHPTSWGRTRLSRVVQDVQHGSDVIESLVHHRLVSKADAALLDSARRVGNLPWALREAAYNGERRLAHQLQVIIHVMTPFVFLGLGLLVGFLAVAYFAPLIKVIEVLL